MLNSGELLLVHFPTSVLQHNTLRAALYGRALEGDVDGAVRVVGLAVGAVASLHRRSADREEGTVDLLVRCAH